MKINDKNALDVLKKEFSDLGPEIIDNFRRKYQQHVDEAVEDEFFCGINRAICAMMEANVDDKKIIDLLIKYWDLNTSNLAKTWRVINFCTQNALKRQKETPKTLYLQGFRGFFVLFPLNSCGWF